MRWELLALLLLFSGAAPAPLVTTSAGKPATVASLTPLPSTGPLPLKQPDPVVIYSAVMEGHLVGLIVAQPTLRGDVRCSIQAPDGVDPMTANLAVRAVVDPDRYCLAWGRLQVLMGNR